jgi:hypothetical protein
MLKTVIAHSLELDSKDAIVDVLVQCHEQLGDLLPQAGLLFTGIDHNHSLILNRINEKYPGIELIGCTTDGELSSVHGVADDSISLTLFSTEEIVFKAGIAERISKDPVTKVKRQVEAIKSGMDQEPVLCIVTPSAVHMEGQEIKFQNMDNVLEGLKQGLGVTFPIFGGVASNPNWQEDYQFYNQNVFTDAVPFLLFSGPLLFSHGVKSGWMPIGEKTTVTHVEKNIVFSIGNQSALDFYKHYLGDFDFMGVIEYPLAIFEEDEESFYLRAPVLFDAEKGSVSFQVSIPEGTAVQLTHATRDKTIEAVKDSVNAAVIQYPGSKPSIALCFTCMARKMVLGTRVQEEYQILKTNFPDLPVSGFYTGGEIGPLGRGKPARHHNETFLTLLMGLK